MDTPKNTPSNAFVQLLTEFPQSMQELSEGLQACVASVKDTGKPAELRYVLKISASGNAMIVTDDIKTKIPVNKRDSAVFFPNENNGLQRDNPQQRTLDLRTVEKPEVEVRDVRAISN